jgi:hypothetical protein
MVDDDGVPYDDDRDRYADSEGDKYSGYVPTDRDADEIISSEREGSFNDFAYDDDNDDNDKGPTEPFETNYYNSVDDDDSEIYHDTGDRDYDDDDDDDGGAEGGDFLDDYDNDSLNGEQIVRSNYYSYDDDDGDHDSTATRLEVEKDHHRGYNDDNSNRLGEEGRYITVADDWEQLNLEELSRLSLASI